ncbi:hypothetical protein H5410_031632 [Solanum commersonii]|uniref:Transposase-associated domain-containing protein n=1 Tax=Solanum commersonii TaxID=4109 RepID=A0A9J5YMX7_SOLCO|nr:hypothetical protein H5410_031632 [Solanum commersonii]
MDHRLWMYNMHYETSVSLKPEFIDDTIMVHLYRNGFKPRYFVWIDHGERDELNGIFYNSMFVDEYNMLAPHSQIRVEHNRVHEMINYAFRVQGGMEPEQYLDEAPNEEARHFYVKGVRIWSCQLKRSRPNRNDEGDIDPVFPLISIFNQNGRGSSKCGKRGFTNMEMQSAMTHIA